MECGRTVIPIILTHHFLIVASQSQLQDVARLRALMLPSLSMLIRYLNVSTRQDYLVKRIHGEEEGEGGRERRKEREREKEGRRGLIISYTSIVIRLYMYMQNTH